MCITNKAQVALDILAYLNEHTAAQDTLEGIVGWWLAEQEIKRQTHIVTEALDELVMGKLIIERRSKDMRSHYRINRRKIREIRSLLERKSNP
jgi:hypothetical protein